MAEPDSPQLGLLLLLGARGAQAVQTDDEGIEQEREDESLQITRPFDPEKIRIRTVNVVVDQIVTRIQYEEIDLAPDFQRMMDVWNDERKSRLIESLLLRIPIPVFYVAADREEVWSVVDGLQRTKTIFDYVTGEFTLQRLEYLTNLDGCSFTQLPHRMQRRIRETQLVVNVIDPGTPEEVMFNIFRRINTGGVTLNGQEIRHALHPGPVRKYLKELAESYEFKRATDYSVRDRRMEDRECVLRFIAFHIDPWEDYTANDLDGYLGTAMKRVNAMDAPTRAVLTADFMRAMRGAYRIFETYAFRKRFAREEGRSRINKALFEVWSVGLARLPDDAVDALTRKHELIIDEFISLMNTDAEFVASISASTGDPARVRKRFRTTQELIERCLHA